VLGISTRFSSLALVLAAVASAFLLGGRHYGDDAVVLAVFVLKDGGGRRAALALVAVLSFVLAFPPFEWPTYWFALAPLAWLWRQAGSDRWNWAAEAFGVGFCMCWLTSPFVRGDFEGFAVGIHAIASAVFGVQIIGIAAGLRGTRRWPILLAAPVAALVASACDLVRVALLGWPLLALGFPAAPTPLAQWAYYVTPFGVSYLLYLVNFLWLPDRSRDGFLSACKSPLVAIGLALAAWFGGSGIASRVDVDSIPFSALVVQPHRVVPAKPSAAEGRESLTSQLDRMTREALAQTPRPDLIVWPETVLRRSGERLGFPEGTDHRSDVVSLSDFFQRLMPVYRTNCLVGAIVVDKSGRRFNSACLITPEGELGRYDKRTLVPWAERIYSAGSDSGALTFVDRSGRPIRLGVSICYEMHFPWLPQFRAAVRPNVFVHLNNESWYGEYPGQQGHGTWACQYRAIETRTWQVVCATWSRSAVIDPRGIVRAILPARPSVLRISPDDETGQGDAPSQPVETR
jgi:apolipoprotein N-acyltransferase